MKKQTAILLLTLITVLVFSGAVSAASDVYVSPTGNNSNSGTDVYHPLEYIYDGVGAVSDGGIVHLAEGTFNSTGNIGIVLSKNITIQGAGQDKTIINAEYIANVFRITPGNTVTIKNLTIMNGAPHYFEGTTYGGAINNKGTLKLEKVTLTHNQADNGGAIYNEGELILTSGLFTNNTANYRGGAIYNLGTMDLVGTFTNNTAALSGGAIYSANPGSNPATFISGSYFNNNKVIGGDGVGGAIDTNLRLWMANTVFNGNTAYLGGAINNEASITMNNIHFMKNTAHAGGAIYNHHGTLNIGVSTFDSNTADDSAGGIFNVGTIYLNAVNFINNHANNCGGGILSGGNLTVYRCNFTSNSADKFGGAILNYHATSLNVMDSNFTKNSAVYDGGAISCDANSVNIDIINSAFLQNTGGGIYFEPLIVGYNKPIVSFNRFVGNTPYGIKRTDPIKPPGWDGPWLINAENNWWGSNSGPNTPHSDKTIGSIDYTPWTKMKLSIGRNGIFAGTVTRIIVDFFSDSDGGYHAPAYGHIPDGTPVIFTTILGEVGSKEITIPTLDGSAYVDFRAFDGAIEEGRMVSGENTMTASADNEIITETTTINLPNTANAANAATTTTTRTGNAVGMQTTGAPIVPLAIAVLTVLGGLAATRKKQ